MVSGLYCSPQDVTITNDGATILKLLEVEHPAAKVLVELADLQVHAIRSIFYCGYFKGELLTGRGAVKRNSSVIMLNTAIF